jgi:hypothetical protein
MCDRLKVILQAFMYDDKVHGKRVQQPPKIKWRNFSAQRHIRAHDHVEWAIERQNRPTAATLRDKKKKWNKMLLSALPWLDISQISGASPIRRNSTRLGSSVELDDLMIVRNFILIPRIPLVQLGAGKDCMQGCFHWEAQPSMKIQCARHNAC